MEKDERQIAREYFKEKGLTYSDIKKKDIEKLRELIKYKLQTYLPTTDHSRSMDLRLSRIRKTDFKYNKDGSVKFGGVWIEGSYFKFREGVYFSKNGFIGFCDWADGSNKIPIITAFTRWCDYLKKELLSKIGDNSEVEK